MRGETNQKWHASATFPSCYSPDEADTFVRAKRPIRVVAPGAVVASRYILDRKLGAGGMGSVWLAYDQSLQSFCAIKVLHENQALDDELRSRFRREATVAARIHSENVVGILEHGEWQGLPYIAMEFIEGEDLDSRLSRLGKLDVYTTYELVLQLARGLHRAHACGIVHRDIKPANVLLTSDNGDQVAKLVDFGVAKEAALSQKGGLTHLGAFLGTPDYASPEQLEGREVDFRSDLWSLGALVFECLTGRMPFDSDSFAEVCAKILHDPVPGLCATEPSLPLTLDAWWYRTMARDPNERYQSAKEFADGFAEAIGCAPVSVSSVPPRLEATTAHAEPVSVSERHTEWRWLRWPALALVCLLLAIAAVVEKPGPSTGRALAADVVPGSSVLDLPRTSANTVVLTPEPAEDAGVSTIGAAELPQGIRLRCDILGAGATAPGQLDGSHAFDSKL